MEMEFQTADLNLTAYLLAKGCELSQVHTQDPRNVRFAFRNGDDLSALVDEFSTGLATVDPLVFSEKLSEVRSILWGVKDKAKREKSGRY